MNQTVRYFLVLAVIVFMAGCGGRDAAPSAPPDASGSPPGISASQPESPAEGGGEFGETSPYQPLAEAVMEQYQTNAIAVSEKFPEAPGDFIFPAEIPVIEFTLNEMGYFVGKILSEDQRYEMWFSVDDTVFDGVKPEGNPHVSSVMFNKIG